MEDTVLVYAARTLDGRLTALFLIQVACAFQCYSSSRIIVHTYVVCSHALPVISHIHVGQYKTALEHMSVRAGTAIPTGGAEGVLAFLYEQKEEAWQFLTERLVTVDPGYMQEEVSPKNGTNPAKGPEERGRGADTDGEAAVTSRPGETDGTSQSDENGIRQHEKQGREQGDKNIKKSGDATSESFSLAQMSAALEEFARACSDRGCAPEGLAVQDLLNFLYLGGQAKVCFRCLTAAEAPLENH